MSNNQIKVITPDNLGQGIVYNPQTKQFEVHFISEAEIEQVQNYVDPQEDDEHYTVYETIKLRDRSSGFVWDANRRVVKNRAPAMDEDATPTVEFRRESGNVYIERGSYIESRVDGESVTGELSESPDLSQFKSTEELNNYLQGKNFKFVTYKRFSNSLEGKPMIRSTTLGAPYPTLEDEENNVTFSAYGSYSTYSSTSIGGMESLVAEAIDDGRITINGSVTYANGENKGQTKTFNITKSILDDRLYSVFGSIPDIGPYDDANHYSFTFSPKNITLKKLGYTYHITFEDYDNGVVIN